MSSDKSNRRTRNWCVVVYPSEQWYRHNYPNGKYDGSEGWGQAPDNWQDELDNLNIKWACSPIHDMDIDDDGHIKKPHWHIILCYNGNKSFEQVKDDVDFLMCPIPQICRDVRSSVRYFIHKDHPHKYQYSQSDIKSFGGFDVGDLFQLSKSEKTQLLTEISLFIREYDIVEYYDLTFYAIDNCTEWVQVIQDNSIYFERLLKSNRHRSRTAETLQKFDEETGEIL